jgi:hypothetical protein
MNMKTVSVKLSMVSFAGQTCARWFIALGGIVLALQGCQTAPGRADAQPLGKAEVQRLFVGNTVESFNLNTKLTSFTYYHPNGELYQERLWARRTGIWTIENDGRICLSFNKRPAKCRHIVRAGERHYKVLPDENGVPQKIVRYRYFAAGNSLAKE